MTLNSKKIALESLRLAFDKVYEATNLFDAKLQNLLNYSSIIISIALTIMASSLYDKVGIIFWVIVSVVLIIYIINFIVIIKGLSPAEFLLPISGEIGDIKKQYYDTSENFALRQAILDHTIFIEKIQEASLVKERAIKISHWLIGIITILIIISIPLGLIYSEPNLLCFFNIKSCIP